jgi:hypothetical protein
MLTGWRLLAFIGLLILLWPGPASHRSPAHGPSTGDTVITPELSSWIDVQLQNRKAGFTLGIVKIHADGARPDIEFGAWGNKTEDGERPDLHVSRHRQMLCSVSHSAPDAV